MAEPQPLFDYTGYLPECPTWSEAEQALYWADIMECEIHRYDIRSGEHQVLQFPEEVGCFALREKGGFIVALRSGIWLTDAHGLLRRKVCDNPSTPSWHGLTMVGPIATGAFMPALSGRRGIITARC